MKKSFYKFRSVLQLLLVVGVILGMDSCSKVVEIPLIDPVKDPSGFSQALNVVGTNNSGNIPTSTSCSFRLDYYQSQAVTTQDASLYVPFSFTSKVEVKGIYLQVQGADNYWDIPIVSQVGGNNSYIVEVIIPRFILNGTVPINFVAYGANGCTTNKVTMSTRIAPPVDICASGNLYTESGSAGLTVKKLLLGNTAGEVEIYYNMYSVPDRLDIKYDGHWAATTNATNLPDADSPPSSICYDGTSGYVSGSKILKINYDPKRSREILVYMNGCYNGGTAWDISVKCPQ